MKRLLSLLLFLPASIAWGGENIWTPIGPAGQDIRGLFVFSNRNFYIFAGTSGGGVFLSDGTGWFPVNDAEINESITSIVGIESNPGCVVCGTPPALWAGTDGGGVFEPLYGFTQWTPNNNGLASLTVTALALGPGDVNTTYTWAATPAGLFRGSSHPTYWGAVGAGLPAPVLAVAVNPQNASNVYAGTNSGVFRSTDLGMTWTAVNAGLPPNGSVRAIAIDPLSPSTLYASLFYTFQCPPPCALPPVPQRGVFKSVDSGDHWTESDSGLPIPVTSLAVDPSSPSNVYAAGYEAGGFGGVFRSTNGGASWKSVNAGLSNLDVRALAFDPHFPSILWAGTAGSGVFSRHFTASDVCDSGQALCLDEGRFQVQVNWQNGASKEAGQAVAITRSTGAFWFFSPDNLELVVKVLDGRSVNGKFWVFYGALSNVEYTITVTDTQTGAVKTYFNPQGQLASVADTSAF